MRTLQFAEGEVQSSSAQGKTQFVVSALLTYGWQLKRAGHWQSNICGVLVRFMTLKIV